MRKIIHEFKIRCHSKPFDIYKEEVCEKGKSGGYWLGYDGVIYYGNRFFIYSKSHQNDWWLSDKYNFKRHDHRKSL